MKKGKKPAVPVTTTTSSAASTPAPSTEDNMAFQYENMMVLDDAMPASSSSAAGPSVPAPRGRVKRKKSIKSETSIDLKGPMEVDGSVKSGAGVTFSGDFAVRDRIEAYGNINVNGSLTCRYVPTLPCPSREEGRYESSENANNPLQQQDKVLWKRPHKRQWSLQVCQGEHRTQPPPLQPSRLADANTAM